MSQCLASFRKSKCTRTLLLMPITTIPSMYILELLVQRKLQDTKLQSISLVPGSGSTCTAIPRQCQQEGRGPPAVMGAPPARRHPAAARVGEGRLCLPGGLSSTAILSTAHSSNQREMSFSSLSI